MLERIIIGVLIGLFMGAVMSPEFEVANKNRVILLLFLLMFMIAFIISSFKFGVIYGMMAIGEIAVGYLIVTRNSD